MTTESEPQKQPKTESEPVHSLRIQRFAVVGSIMVLIAAWGVFSWLTRPISLDQIDTWIRQQQWNKAEPAVRRYLENNPDDVRALLLLARIHGGRREFVRCAEVLKSVPKELPERSESLFRAGEAYKQGGYWKQAIATWKECLEEPQDIGGMLHQRARWEICSAYAIQLRRSELYDMTWEMYQTFPEPRRHDPLLMRIRSESEMVEPRNAQAQLFPAIKNDPDDIYSRRAVGLYHLEIGEKEQARTQLIRCVQDDEENPIMWESWLLCLHRTGDSFGLEQAVLDLPRSTESSHSCWFYRGLVAESQSKIKQARDCFQKAVDLAPSIPDYRQRLGQVLLRLNESELAKPQLERHKELVQARESLQTAFEEYRKQMKPSAEYFFRFGQARQQMGIGDEAEAWYKLALVHDPAHGPAANALAKLTKS